LTSDQLRDQITPEAALLSRYARSGPLKGPSGSRVQALKKKDVL